MGKIGAIMLAAVLAPVFATEWETDFEAAKDRAAAENKALLLDFTGSDWCGCCNQLRKTVLDTPAFEAYAKDKFICVEVDMPRTKKQTQELAGQNKKLCETYATRMFPTILVLSPEGDVLGGFIGMRPTQEAAAAPLDAALANLPKLRAARKAEGLERAKALAEIHASLPMELKEAAHAYAKEIEALDPDNVCGFRKSAAQIPFREFMHKVNSAGSDLPQVLALLEERLADCNEDEKPELLRLKGMTLTMAAETEEDLLTAKRTLLEAADLMGGGRKSAMLRDYVERDFSDLPALLSRVKARRAEEKRPPAK